MVNPDILYKDICLKKSLMSLLKIIGLREPMEPKSILLTNSTINLLYVRVTPIRMSNPQEEKMAYGEPEGS